MRQLATAILLHFLCSGDIFAVIPARGWKAAPAKAIGLIKHQNVAEAFTNL